MYDLFPGAQIDDIDRDLLKYKWNLLGKTERTKYLRRHTYIDGKQVSFMMHRVIMERILGRPLVKGEQVDHINLDKLDNRRSNLRLANHSQNKCNTAISPRNKSGVKGVHWSKVANKWCAMIGINSKTVYIGTFDNIEDAKQAYREKALEVFGEFARFE